MSRPIRIRVAAIAGLFYSADPDALRANVRRQLDSVEPVDIPGSRLVIAPHAGHQYSGPVAAHAYQRLVRSCRRIALLGPSHRVRFTGMALSTADYFETPLGTIPVDRAGADKLTNTHSTLAALDEAHRLEHSLEVHLPFLQEQLGAFELLPIVVGDATPTAVAAVIESIWEDDDYAIVVSTDLSHFHEYHAAKTIDAETARAIKRRDTNIRPDQACGCQPLNGALHFAEQRDLSVSELALLNSGDTAGSRERVVGYASFAIA
ncbi:MAG: AmmeMemoRadiSam system protein B [Pseudomonadota bacterium]